MQTTQGSVLQSLRAVQSFLDVNADKLSGVVTTGARKRLDIAISELSGHTSDQSGSVIASQGATRKHRSLRRALLRDHMAPIASIAKADLPVTPEIEPLRMPAGRPTAERLAQLAYGMAKEAGRHAPVFISAGLPEDFISSLTSAADAMLAAINDRTQNRGVRSGATKSIKQKLTGARKIVHVLDKFVRSALKDDSGLLASWNLVKRVPRVAGRVPAAIPAVPPTTGTTSVAPPAQGATPPQPPPDSPPATSTPEPTQ